MGLIISDTAPRIQYTAANTQTQFTIPFEFFADADIKVIKTASNGTDTTLTLASSPANATQYSVEGAGVSSGGTRRITLGGASTNGDIYTIFRELAVERTSDFPVSGNFPIETLNTELDKITAMIQQNESDNKFSPQAKSSTSTAYGLIFPELVANKLLTVNSAGTALQFSQEIGTYKGTDATTTTAAYSIRDIVKSTTAGQLNNVYICIQDSPVGTALTNTSYWSLLIDAVSAATSATASASSATNSANSATASANSATASANSATTSGNSATASANSATASANSATAAAASADAFDDIYLGSKSSDPTTDNDGDALAAGMLYFNTSTDFLRVYTGSAWQNAAVDTTGFITLSGTQTITNKTLTTPKIGTSILDTNGNELAKLTATGSAVNEFTVANAASGGNPTLSSTGGDSNIDLDLLAKGSGHVTVRGNTNSGAIQFNCESNSHGQIVKSQPHSASVTNEMLLPAGASSTLVSLVSTDTLTNKTLTAPKINEDVVVTSTATELNILDGATVTTAEINYSDVATLGTTAASKVFTADANNLTKVSGAVLNIEDTLTDGSTIAWNVINSPVAKVQLGGNRTLSAPSGTTPASGQFVSLLIIQDGTGSRSLTFNAVYEFTGDVAPVLTTTAAKGDLFVFRYNGSKWLEVGRNLNLTLS